MLARQQASLHTPGAVREMLGRARQLRREDPSRGCQWAGLAWSAALRVRGQDSRVLQALALAEKGNCWRLLGQWHRSENHFRMAATVLEAHPDSPAALEIHLLAASLQIQRERWVHAFGSLSQATRIATETGDLDAQARCLLKRGIACKELGEWDEAVRLSLEAWRVARDAGSEIGRLQALHNVGATYTDGGWYREALTYSEVLKRYYPESGVHLWARGLWVRGRIECGLDRWGTGLEYLQQARRMLGSYSWDLAELLCDEATARLRLGQLREVVPLAGIAEAAYRAMGLPAKARQAASHYRAAATGQLAAIELARDLLRATRSGRRR